VDGRSLPDLGRRGEGWFAVQVVLFVAIGLLGGVGSAWGGEGRVLSVVVGSVLIAAGGLLSFRGLVDLRDNLTPFPRPMPGAELVETGAYSLARHPIYGGLILGAVGWGLAAASPLALVGAAVLAGFFTLKSSREERWLAEQFAGYGSYKARTRRMIPWIY